MNRKNNQNAKVDEDTLWTIARLEVMTEMGEPTTDSEYSTWNSDVRFSAWQDARYSGILECQFDSYRAGEL